MRRVGYRALAMLLLGGLLFGALLLAACGQEEEEPGDSIGFDVDGNPTEISPIATEDGAGSGDTTDGSAGEPADGPTGGPTGGPSGGPAGGPAANAAGVSVEVVDTVACVFTRDSMLYGGVAYTNTGRTAIVLQEAVFTFRYSGGSKESKFSPIAAEFDVVLPGETAYCTLWLPYEEGQTIAAEVTLEAALTAVAAEQSPTQLQVSSGYLVQNYPRFATLSGRLQNVTDQAVDMAMIYAGFYDAEGSLIGVWYFPRNALLQPGAGTPFVTRMETLPIPGIAENTAEVRFRAFGM